MPVLQVARYPRSRCRCGQMEGKAFSEKNSPLTILILTVNFVFPSQRELSLLVQQEKMEIFFRFSGNIEPLIIIPHEGCYAKSSLPPPWEHEGVST
jgi:hypothetical protein